MPPIHRDLTPEQGRALDKAIADPCLTSGPTFLADPGIVAGGLYETLAIDVPGHHWVGGWHGNTTPQQNAIINLIGPQ